MCGIYCALCVRGAYQHKIPESIESELAHRGPDSQQTQTVDIDSHHRLIFQATTLHQQGVVRQPVTDADGNILLWNGEVFSGHLHSHASDTQAVLSSLQTTSVENTFELIRGPYAFVYFCKREKRLWFGRDMLGRRSLLISNAENMADVVFELSSVSDGSYRYREVDTVGLFYFDLGSAHSKAVLLPWAHHPFNDAMVEGGIKAPIGEPLRRQANYQLPPLEHLDSESVLSRLLDTRFFDTYVNGLEKALTEAVRIRVEHTLTFCRKCTVLGWGCNRSKIAILYSGGIDSALLAYLAHVSLPPNEPIDLLNISFAPNAPDRKTGLLAYAELSALSPGRHWNFVQIDVNLQQLQKARDTRVKRLLKPSKTVLDDSIGCAIWLACRGRGTLLETGEDYVCEARVVLLGMGADEQLGGYSAHRKRFKSEGYSGVNDEIRLQMARIGLRNLGRDDRVVSSHGREARFPYLDEDVVNYLNSVPVDVKTRPDLDRKVGDKALLRFLAFKLGLRTVATFEKRAIQFGSRIAKLESKERGQDECERLE